MLLRRALYHCSTRSPTTLWSRSSWLGEVLVSALCSCCFLAHRLLYDIFVLCYSPWCFYFATQIPGVIVVIISFDTFQMTWTDELITDRAVFVLSLVLCCFGLWFLFVLLLLGSFCFVCFFGWISSLIFLLKMLFKSASKSSFFRSGVEIRFWSYNFRRRWRKPTIVRKTLKAQWIDPYSVPLLYTLSIRWCCHCINSLNLKYATGFPACLTTWREPYRVGRKKNCSNLIFGAVKHWLFGLQEVVLLSNTSPWKQLLYCATADLQTRGFGGGREEN